MKINKTVSAFVLSLIGTSLLTSCSKSNDDPNLSYLDSPFKVVIQGEMGEFAPSTRSTAESCLRMRWDNGDVVYAYGSDGSCIKYLGRLIVSVEDGNDYVATMTGTLSAAPADSSNTLFLIHSPLLTSAPELDGNDLKVDLMSQSADVTPFVAYAIVKNVIQKDSLTVSDLKTKFSFATSVLNINAIGISENVSLTSAAVSDIETVCKLTIDSSNGTFVIGNDGVKGIITKALSETDSLSRSHFYVGVPKFSAEATGRILTVTAGGENYYDYDVMQDACAENSYVSYMYDVKTLKYIDEYGQNRGDGMYIAATGCVWAPVNCGYEPKNYKYGKLYQWGRKYGCGYKDTHDANSDAGDLIQAKRSSSAPIAASDEVSSIFYNTLSPYNDWLTPKDDSRWDATGGSSESHKPVKNVMDPCPEGWRVPTLAEMNALKGERWSGDLQIGTHGVLDNVKGKYFDGSDKSIPTSGLFLPAAGYRNSGGGPNEREGSGHYWTSSVSGEEAYHLTFNSTLTYTSEYFRPNAYSVRCVQE